MGKLICISTHKGGAGKTTVATNLALGLASKYPNKNICLLDLDGQCGVSITFGKHPNKYIDKSILTIICGQKKYSEVLENNIEYNNIKYNNLYILFAEPDIKGFDHIVNKDINIQTNFTNSLKHLKKNFDYVIIDTPPSFSTINFLTFFEADIIICPFEPERQNVEGCNAVIKELSKKEYTHKPIIYLLPIKVRERTLIDKALLEYVQTMVNTSEYNNLKLANLKIPNSTQYKTIVAKENIPLICSKSKSKAVLTQKELLDSLINEIDRLNF